MELPHWIPVFPTLLQAPSIPTTLEASKGQPEHKENSIRACRNRSNNSPKPCWPHLLLCDPCLRKGPLVPRRQHVRTACLPEQTYRRIKPLCSRLWGNSLIQKAVLGSWQGKAWGYTENLFFFLPFVHWPAFTPPPQISIELTSQCTKHPRRMAGRFSLWVLDLFYSYHTKEGINNSECSCAFQDQMDVMGGLLNNS